LHLCPLPIVRRVRRGGDRNTPQAFSHFTYVASNGEHLVTDIQGVGDMYTDPQVLRGEQEKGGKLPKPLFSVSISNQRNTIMCPFTGIRTPPDPPPVICFYGLIF